MVSRDYKLSMRKQCELLQLSRSRLYYRPVGKWLTYYKAERPHSTHGILTPNEAYASKIEPMR